MSKSDRTRQFIIEKTAPIFNRKGFAGTSLSDMTEATGLTKGAIYGNFDNKDDVALHAFDYNVGQIIAGIQAEMAGASSNLEKLLAYPRFYRKALQKPVLHLGCPIVNTATEADDTHPALEARVRKILERWQKDLVHHITRGQAAGEIRPAADAGRCARLIITLIEGGILLAKATNDRAFLLEAIEGVEALIREELEV